MYLYNISAYNISLWESNIRLKQVQICFCSTLRLLQPLWGTQCTDAVLQIKPKHPRYFKYLQKQPPVSTYFKGSDSRQKTSVERGFLNGLLAWPGEFEYNVFQFLKTNKLSVSVKDMLGPSSIKKRGANTS